MSQCIEAKNEMQRVLPREIEVSQKSVGLLRCLNTIQVEVCVETQRYSRV